MRGANKSRLHSLERWSPTLFLAGGGLLVVFAALNGMGALTDQTVEYNGFEFGYVLGFLGLLGLYPSLTQRSPWIARAGAVAAASGIVGLSVITVHDLTQLAGVRSGNPPGWSLILVLALVGFLVGYFCFGIASLRTDQYPRTVGLVLLVPGIIVVLMLLHMAAGYASDLTAFVISTGQAMAHLAIGASLRTRSARVAQDEPPSDSDVKVTTHD